MFWLLVFSWSKCGGTKTQKIGEKMCWSKWTPPPLPKMFIFSFLGGKGIIFNSQLYPDGGEDAEAMFDDAWAEFCGPLTWEDPSDLKPGPGKAATGDLCVQARGRLSYQRASALGAERHHRAAQKRKFALLGQALCCSFQLTPFTLLKALSWSKP